MTTTTDETFYIILDEVRIKSEVPIVNGSTFIDQNTVQAILTEELKRQAAETWKLRIPVFLTYTKNKIQNTDHQFIDIIYLPETEIKAIQYALSVYQTGFFDDFTTRALDALHSNGGIPYIENHRWAITPELMDDIILKANNRLANDELMPTLTAISDFLENNHVGEFFYSIVVFWAAARMPMGEAFDKTVAEAVKIVDDGVYFRGTTEGFAGGEGLQRIGITPASTDPVVSTVFATEAENFGEGVLYIAKSTDMTGVNILEGNVLNALECEVGFELLPEQFASRASIKITAQQARSVLKEMGIEVPSKIYDKAGIDSALGATPRLTKEQTIEFLQRVLGIINN